jgi:hypothetical protein
MHLLNHLLILIKKEPLLFLKRKHIDRLNVFINKHNNTVLVSLEKTRDNNYKITNMSLLSSLNYKLISNELLVAKEKDNLNCTSFLASVFSERISCLSVGLITRPAACRLVTDYGHDYSGVKPLFSILIEYLLKKYRAEADRMEKVEYVTKGKNIDDNVPESFFNALNDTARRTFLKKAMNCVGDFCKSVEGGRRSTRKIRR